MSGDQIDHYREAEDTLEVVTFTNVSEQAHSYTDYALAEATLALAYEQRTANLIALYNMTEANCVGMSTAAPMSRENWDSIAQQIRERLGLA